MRVPIPPGRIDITDAAIRIEIEARLIMMGQNLGLAMNRPSTVGISDAVERARKLAWDLGGHAGHDAGWSAATRVLTAMVPPYEQSSRAFWTTPLGRALAWWTGGEGTTARRRMIAEVAQSVSRTAVTKMIRDGFLLTGTDGDVTPTSLARRLQYRHPNPIMEANDA